MYTRIRKRPIAEINVVPYIDVMLVLLIIFMMTSPLLSSGIEVKLPEADAQQIPPSENEPIVINVDRQGLLYINYGEAQDTAVSANELQKRVRTLVKLQPQTTILVGADTAAEYGKVVQMMVLLQEVGVRDFGMLTESQGQGRNLEYQP